MTSTGEQEKAKTEPFESSNPSGKEEIEAASTTMDEAKPTEMAAHPPPAPVEEPKSTSSWFPSLTIPPNLTSQFNTFSSSFLQVTSKVSAAATTLVQKTLPQRPTTPTEDQPPDEPTHSEKFDTSVDENKEASTIGIDITSLLTDLSSTMMKGAQQFKHVVEGQSLIGNFSKEHEKFLTEKRTQQRREDAAVPPWVGYVEEEDMKNQILALSKEKRNFLRSPPPGANYHFDMAVVYPVAMATLEVDEDLKNMRFELVPKQINEEAFWCNYFYRVSLIKQSTQLSALTQDKPNEETVRSTNQQRDRTASDSQEKSSDPNQEFVSEDYDTSAVSMDEIRREIEELTEPKNSNKTGTKKAGSPDESDWDKSLADELDNVSAEELEAQINQMLSGDNK